MASRPLDSTLPQARGFASPAAARPGLAAGTAILYLSLVVLIPLAALLWAVVGGGWSEFWDAVRAPDAVAALKLTVAVSLIVVALNAFFGTLVDLPFALPTIVVGVILLLLYGSSSPIGVDVSYSRAGIVLALMFETLPFVVRSVQPVLYELDRDMEQAAASLGAAPVTAVRRVIFPNLLPAILSGRQHPVPDPGGLGADLRTDRERQPGRRGRGVGRAARPRPDHPDADQLRPALGDAP